MARYRSARLVTVGLGRDPGEIHRAPRYRGSLTICLQRKGCMSDGYHKKPLAFLARN
jgi:hypothetical protein